MAKRPCRCGFPWNFPGEPGDFFRHAVQHGLEQRRVRLDILARSAEGAAAVQAGRGDLHARLHGGRVKIAGKAVPFSVADILPD